MDNLSAYGSKSHGKPLYHGGPSEFWAANDVRMIDDYGNTVFDASEVDGWVRLTRPRGDPFDGAAESDTEECNVCNDRLPSERLCDHLFWNERDGGIAGAGHDEPDADGLDDIEVAVRRLGCARALRRGGLSVSWIVDGAYARYMHATPWPHEEFSDESDEGVGLAWLRTLDKKTTEANAAVLRRLNAIVAVQNLRRASGERCYRVKVDRREPTFVSERVSWAEALATANRVRREHGSPGAWIVRMVPKKARRP